MKKQDMLDTNMLLLHGLIENPLIVEMETKRLAYEQKRQEIEEMVERLMGADENLDDLLTAVTMIHEKGDI